MIFHKIFLFLKPGFRKGFKLAEMRPAFFVYTLQLVISAWIKQRTNGYMHEILLLLLGEFRAEVAHFLNTDQKKDGFHIRLLSKSFHQFFLQCPPSDLEVILYIHCAKITRQGIIPPAA